jgi:hypothetical protein
VNARAALLGLLCVVGPRAVRAQVLDGAVQMSRARFRGVVPGRREDLSGLAVGLRAFTSWRRLSLEASYAQGRLSASEGSGPSRSLVDGSVLIASHPLPWLAFKVGPELRAYSAPGGTERWVLWQYRARAETPVISPTLPLRAHVELWAALLSSVNVAPGAAGARGGEAGLVWRMPGSPLWFRISYTVDQAKLKDNARTEALEAVVVTVSLSGR